MRERKNGLKERKKKMIEWGGGGGKKGRGEGAKKLINCVKYISVIGYYVIISE